MTVSIDLNNVEFGALRVREKSIDAATQKPMSSQYRQARRDFKSGIDYLDKAGVDIDVFMDDSLGYKLLNVALIDKERTIYRTFVSTPVKNAWDVLANAVAMGMELVNHDSQTLKEWNETVDVFDVAPQLNLEREVVSKTKSRLSHRGNRYSTEFFTTPEIQTKIDKAIELRQKRRGQ